ncbi:hypothetical protein D3C73_788440 [compost metagenome]
MLRTAVVSITALRPVRRHFKAPAILKNSDGAMRKSGGNTARKNTHDLFRPRRSRQVHIMHRPAKQLIADAASNKISLMSLLQ